MTNGHIIMFTSRNQQTMTGQQTGAYDVLTATSANVGTLVATNAIVTCNLSAVAFSGYCITDSLTTTNSMRAASATAVSTLNTNMASYLPLAGGNVSGNVNVGGTLYASNVNAIAGYTSTYAYETHSSNLVINNSGTGPALVVTQSQTGPLGAQPVAQFFNGAGTAALVIDNNGNVGVNKQSAGFELDVSGVVAAVGLSGCITDSTSTTSSSLAASATAVKSAYDLASAAVPSSGGVVSGTLAVGKPSVDLGYCVDVSGIVRASAFQLVSGLAIGGGGGTNYWDISGTSIWAHAGSNVGVGRPPTGTYTLDVYGNANVSGTTKFVGAVGIGKDASGCSLDVSGSVSVSRYLKTGHCAFMYTNAGAGTPDQNNIIFHYTLKTYEIGANFNATTFSFTAPVSGIYMFDAISFSTTYWGFAINGTIQTTYIAGSAANIGTKKLHETIFLSSGDVVDVRSADVAAYIDPSCYFSGLLIFAT